MQVDGAVTETAISDLQKGVAINVDGKIYNTQPCEVFLLDEEPLLPQRDPPIRFRKEIPAPWLRMILKEGKNRQVRKMTAKTGFPTLRLVRYRMEGLSVENMQPGDRQALSKEMVYDKLFYGKNK